MEKIKITAQTREQIGKQPTKKARRLGNIPAIIYGRGSNLAVSVGHDGMKALGGIRFSANTIIDMELARDSRIDTIPVLIKEVQYNPVTEKVMHLDFLRIALDEKIRVKIPVILKGEAQGVKEGAVVSHILRELEVEALPADIPVKVELDVSGLSLGRSLHVSDVKLGDNVKILTAVIETIVTVVAHVEEEVAVAAVEGTPAAEPEVIKEKKEEEGEEGVEEGKGEGKGKADGKAKKEEKKEAKPEAKKEEKPKK
jgi:large subunit ribosomal protein L25